MNRNINRISFMFWDSTGHSVKLGYQKPTAESVEFYIKQLVEFCNVPKEDVILLLEEKTLPMLKELDREFDFDLQAKEASLIEKNWLNRRK